MEEMYKGYKIKVFKKVFKKEYKNYYEVCKCCKHQGWITKKLKTPIYISNIISSGQIISTGESDTIEMALSKAKELINK